MTFTLPQLTKSASVLASAMLVTALTGCQKPADAPSNTNSNADKPSASSATPNTSPSTGGGGNMAGKTLRVATEGTYKPFSITNPDGSLTGFDVEYIKALCDDMKATCDIKPYDWDSLLPGLMAKKYDVVIDAMSMTPERKAQVDFTEPYFTNTLVFLTKKGSPINPDDPAQIDSHTVAAQKSTMSTQWLDKNHPKATQKVYESIDNAFLDLKSGRSDMMIADKAPAMYWTTTPEGQGFEVKGKEIDIGDTMGIIVRKGDPVREDLNKAIANVKANGTYDKIYQKYFGNTTTTTAAASSTTTTTTVTQTTSAVSATQ